MTPTTFTFDPNAFAGFGPVGGPLAAGLWLVFGPLVVVVAYLAAAGGFNLGVALPFNFTLTVPPGLVGGFLAVLAGLAGMICFGVLGAIVAVVVVVYAVRVLARRA